MLQIVLMFEREGEGYADGALFWSTLYSGMCVCALSYKHTRTPLSPPPHYDRTCKDLRSTCAELRKQLAEALAAKHVKKETGLGLGLDVQVSWS